MDQSQFSKNKSKSNYFGKNSNNLIGVSLVILSGFMLSINGAIGKQLGQDLHPFFLTFQNSETRQSV